MANGKRMPAAHPRFTSAEDLKSGITGRHRSQRDECQDGIAFRLPRSDRGNREALRRSPDLLTRSWSSAGSIIAALAFKSSNTPGQFRQAGEPRVLLLELTKGACRRAPNGLCVTNYLAI
jgi:hypothetical protein